MSGVLRHIMNDRRDDPRRIFVVRRVRIVEDVLLVRATTEVTARLSAESCKPDTCLLYTSPSPRDRTRSRMPSSACKKKKTLKHDETNIRKAIQNVYNDQTKTSKVM